jgi:hypothetical protein
MAQLQRFSISKRTISPISRSLLNGGTQGGYGRSKSLGNGNGCKVICLIAGKIKEPGSFPGAAALLAHGMHLKQPAAPLQDGEKFFLAAQLRQINRIYWQNQKDVVLTRPYP